MEIFAEAEATDMEGDEDDVLSEAGEDLGSLARRAPHEVGPLMGNQGSARPSSLGKRKAPAEQPTNPNKGTDDEMPSFQMSNAEMLKDIWRVDQRPDFLRDEATLNAMPMKLILELRGLHDYSEKSNKGTNFE